MIESPFATVRLRQRVTKGAGNRTKALTMVFKLLTMAEERWRKLNGAHLLPLVRAGVTLVDGVQVERTKSNEDRKKAAWSRVAAASAPADRRWPPSLQADRAPALSPPSRRY